jgi:hypothetical protein
MSSQAGDLPQDIEQLSALVRELQAENTQLRSLLKDVAQQAFGVRSERASVILGDQGHLALGDLAGVPTNAANDDAAPVGPASTPQARAESLARPPRAHREAYSSR